MEDLLITTEVLAATLLSFMLALIIEPLLVMAVLGLAKKAARGRPPRSLQEASVSELRLLAKGPQISPRE